MRLFRELSAGAHAKLDELNRARVDSMVARARQLEEQINQEAFDTAAAFLVRVLAPHAEDEQVELQEDFVAMLQLVYHAGIATAYADDNSTDEIASDLSLRLIGAAVADGQQKGTQKQREKGDKYREAASAYIAAHGPNVTPTGTAAAIMKQHGWEVNEKVVRTAIKSLFELNDKLGEYRPKAVQAPDCPGTL